MVVTMVDGSACKYARRLTRWCVMAGRPRRMPLSLSLSLSLAMCVVKLALSFSLSFSSVCRRAAGGRLSSPVVETTADASQCADVWQGASPTTVYDCDKNIS